MRKDSKNIQKNIGRDKASHAKVKHNNNVLIYKILLSKIIIKNLCLNLRIQIYFLINILKA